MASAVALAAAVLAAQSVQHAAAAAADAVPYGDAALDTSVSWKYDAGASDDFGGNSLQSSKWDQSIEGWTGTAPGFFQDSNVVLTGAGKLNLVTKFEDGATPPGSECSCGFEDVTLPLVTSSKMFQYGYFEVKAKFADAKVLSSFWLQGKTGEINVFETDGAKASSNYHCFDPSDGSATVEASEVLSAAGFDPSDAFHVYGLEWSASGIKYYVDGKMVRQVTSAKAGCLDQPMAIILSVEPTSSTPASFGTYTSKVEYFRRWVAGAPATTTKAPVTTTKAPVTTTKKITTTKASVTTTKAPVTTTKKVTTTKAPVTTTKPDRKSVV